MYCHHNYAHAANYPNERLPSMLKGADAAMSAVCAVYGLQTQTRPVYLTTSECEARSPIDDDDDDGDYPDKFEESPEDYLQLDLNEMKDDPFEIFDVKATSKDHIGGSEKIEWVGDKFRHAQADENLGDYSEEWITDGLDAMDWVKGYRGIHWLNKAEHKEGNVAYMTVYPLYLGLANA